MMTPERRAFLDEQLRRPIRAAVKHDGATIAEIVYLLTRMLPELCGREFAHGQIDAAFDLARGAEQL